MLRTARTPRVALVQSIQMHYELLPAFLSLASPDVELTLFLPLHDHCCVDWHYWLTMYQKKTLPPLRDFKDLEHVAKGEFDLFILPTDDDRIGKVCKDLGPVVTLNHSPKIRFQALRSFNVRKFQHCEDGGNFHEPFPVTMPCFIPRESLKTARNLQPVPNGTKRIKGVPGNIDSMFCKQVVVIGLGDGRDVDCHAMVAILNNPTVQVTVLTRSALQIQSIFAASESGLSPIYIPEAPAHYMFDCLLRADFVFIPRTGDYIEKRMSGVIPLALSYGKTMIMPERMRSELGIPETAAIGYDAVANMKNEMARVLDKKLEQESILSFRDACIQRFQESWRGEIFAAKCFPGANQEGGL